MTRDEAIKILQDHECSIHEGWEAEKSVDAFVALGLLKFDEPKGDGADDKLEIQFKRDGFFRRTEIAYVFNVLDELNLMIVEKGSAR